MAVALAGLAEPRHTSGCARSRYGGPLRALALLGDRGASRCIKHYNTLRPFLWLALKMSNRYSQCQVVAKSLLVDLPRLGHDLIRIHPSLVENGSARTCAEPWFK